MRVFFDVVYGERSQRRKHWKDQDGELGGFATEGESVEVPFFEQS